MNYWAMVGLLLLGSAIGFFAWALIFMICCPKIGTLIMDLSREDKDIAQFVFGNMSLENISKFRQGRLEIKINNLKSLDEVRKKSNPHNGN